MVATARPKAAATASAARCGTLRASVRSVKKKPAWTAGRRAIVAVDQPRERRRRVPPPRRGVRARAAGRRAFHRNAPRAMANEAARPIGASAATGGGAGLGQPVACRGAILVDLEAPRQRRSLQVDDDRAGQHLVQPDEPHRRVGDDPPVGRRRRQPFRRRRPSQAGRRAGTPSRAPGSAPPAAAPTPPATRRPAGRAQPRGTPGPRRSRRPRRRRWRRRAPASAGAA